MSSRSINIILTVKQSVFGAIILLLANHSFAQGNISVAGGSATINMVNNVFLTAQDINLQSGNSFIVNNSYLQSGGSITSSGTLDAANGTLEMNSSSAQSIAGSMFAKKAVKNLIVSNTSAGLSISSDANDTLKITGTLSFGNFGSTLNTGDNITLVSDSNGTANVGVVGPGNAINGKAIVERYINIGTAAGQHAKVWQFLSTPTIGQTVRESWMENGSKVSTGYGTQITGAGGTAAGFDTATATPSIKTYIAATDSWTGVTNANNALYNPKGYMVFVRGDKGVTVYNQPANTTTLRTKGTLLTGSLSPISLIPDKMESVGNPYASSIDFTLITKDAGIDDKFYVWDPYLYGSYGLGGYQTLSSANNWEPVPGGTQSYPTGILSRTIHSGQAFFVHATLNAVPSYTLTFNEDCKAVNSSPNFTRQMNRSSGQKQFFHTSLFTGADGIIADGNVVIFDRNFSDKIDGSDAIKIMNSGENFGLKRAGNLLSIEAKKPVSISDTIYYNMSNLKARTYQLRFAPDNMDGSGLEAYLLDQFLNTSIPVSLTDSSYVNINVTGNAASSAANRFKVVFRTLSALPVTVTSIKAYTKENNIAVEWQVENEKDMLQYEVEKSVDGSAFSKVSTVAVSNASGNTNYKWLDKDISGGYNYYRVRSVDRNGQASFTRIVKVFVDESTTDIKVYPNPVTNGTINLQLNNAIRGTFAARLLNPLGQTISLKKIDHTGGNRSEVFKLEGNFPTGIYQLDITDPDGKIILIKVLVQ